jgi:hypothetical protein
MQKGYVDIGETIRTESARNMKALFMERVVTQQTHILENGARVMTMLDPEKETDDRLVCVLDEVYRQMRTCDPKKYDKEVCPRMKEIQLIMNPSNDADQQYHCAINRITLSQLLILQSHHQLTKNVTITFLHIDFSYQVADIA